VATCTWNATTNTDFETDSNWGVGGHAHAGDTIVIANATAPTTTRPATGEFGFTIESALTVADLVAWLAGATVGNVTVNHDSAAVTCSADIFGAVSVLKGKLSLGDNLDHDGTLDIATGALLEIHYGYNVIQAVTIAGTLRILYGDIEPGGMVCNDTINLTGMIDASSIGAVIECLAMGGVGITGAGGTIILGATSAGLGQINLTSCTWIITPGAKWTFGEWAAGTQSLGGNAANLDLVFNKAGATFTLADAVVRDVTLTDGTLTLTNLTCHVLTLAAGKTANLAGQIRLGAAPVFGAAAVLHLGGSVIIPTATFLFDAAALATCDHTSCCMFGNGAAVLTVDNLPAQATPIQCYCDACNGGSNHATAAVFHPGPPQDY